MQEYFNQKLTKSIDITTMRNMRNEGMTNKEIAERCGCSVGSVRRYLGNLTKEERSKINAVVAHSRTPEQVRGRTLHKARMASAESAVNKETIIRPISKLSMVSMLVQLKGSYHSYFVDTVDKKITFTRENAPDIIMSTEQLGNYIMELQELFTVIGTTTK